MYWSNTLAFGGKAEKLRWVILSVIIILAIVSILFIIFFAINGFDGSLQFSAILALCYSIVLLFSAVWLFVYGLRLQIRLNNHRSVDKTVGLTVRLKELIRINVVLFCCVACFTGRSIALFMVFLWDLDVNIPPFTWPLVVWFLLTEWIPDIIPVSNYFTIFYLYIFMNVL